MKKHEFYQKYANTPLEKRNVPLEKNYGTDLPKCLSAYYAEMRDSEKKVLIQQLRQDELLKSVDEFLSTPVGNEETQ